MTILIGAVHNNEIIIGADSLWTWDTSFVRESKTSKFLSMGQDVLIASAGQDKFSQLLIKVIKATPELLRLETYTDLLALTEALQKEVLDSGVGDPGENELPVHDLEFLVASKLSLNLWIISSDYAVHQYDDYVCAGSGSTLGEGAMRALAKKGIHGEEAVRTAIETACDLHPFCGGRIEIKKISAGPKSQK